MRAILFAGFVALGTLFLPHGALAAPAHASTVSLRAQVLRLINRDRRAAHLAPLHNAGKLDRAALRHSLDMARHNYLSHSTPSGLSPYARMARLGIRYNCAGENIGYDVGSAQGSMVEAIEVAMMHSPEHRANLLRASFTRVGIGIALTGNKLYVTEDFAG